MGCNEMASPFFPPNFLLQMQSPHEEDGHHPPSSLAALLPAAACSNPPEFHGVAALLGNRSVSFSGVAEPGGAAAGGGGGGGEDELSDDCSHVGEKKRRLSTEQVRTLERNFELGNKLEPERKMQLARALGLQPRQVAIWFQNRRARWKTKQLEKDYDVLKRQFDAVKAENDALLLQNKKLHAEVMALKGREAAAEPINLNKDTEGSCSNRSDNSSDVNLDVSRTSAIDSPLHAHHHGGPRPAAAASFFQPIRPAPAGVAHLLLQAPSSTRPAELLQCPKAEHGGVVQDHESLCNMFCGLDDQAGFWAWSEQHSFP